MDCLKSLVTPYKHTVAWVKLKSVRQVRTEGHVKEKC